VGLYYGLVSFVLLRIVGRGVISGSGEFLQRPLQLSRPLTETPAGALDNGIKIRT